MPPRKIHKASWRKSPKPNGWETRIRPPILERDNNRCTWIEGEEDGGSWQQWAHINRCTLKATDVDHIGDRDNHEPDNLRSLCGWHHDKRSGRQANAARKARVELRKRPTPQHPGLTT